MPKTPRAFARAWLLPVCLVVVVFIVLLMREAFLPPRGVLTADLDAAVTDTVIRIQDGADLPGEGYVRIGDELLRIRRTTPDGGPVNNGRLLRENPDTFKIEERGSHGTTPGDHAVGDEVSTTDGVFFPKSNSTFAQGVDTLFFVILWVTGLAFILTEAFLLYCIAGFRSRPGERSHYTHGNHRLEMFWTVGIAVALLLLAIVQWDMWKEIKTEQPTPAENPVKVQVMARQFDWYFRHAGLDGRFGTEDDVPSLGTLKVPAGRKVAIQLRSQDVLHSFFLPNFRVKQDSVPGLRIPVWFEPQETGIFPIMCAELCGLGHTTMNGTLEVLPPEVFQEWLEERSGRLREEIVEYETERPEWHNEYWWWWDRNPVRLGYSGSSSVQ